jgi:DNA adenine methylase
MNDITRPALRYPGGKFRDGYWIISNFPRHLTYCEPFGGGGSVLLLKQPSTYEFYNDLDGEVVNFFKMLRDKGSELIEKIQLTPYSRVEQELARFPDGDELERARRFYTRSWQTMNGAEHRYDSGWRNLYRRSRGSNVVREWNNVEHLHAIAWRLKQVQIENRPALDLVKRIDTEETLFYFDPPYVKSTRAKNHRDMYKFELNDADHRQIAEVVHSLSGMSIISGYDCELYQELYKDFYLVKKKTTKNHGKTAVECLWLSPNVAARQQQLSLFEVQYG